MQRLSTAFLFLLLLPGLVGALPFGLLPVLAHGLGGQGSSSDPSPAPAHTPAREFLAEALRSQPEGKGLDRHRHRRRIELARPERLCDTVVVAFHGTGAFDPRSAPALLRLRDWEGELPGRNLGGLVRLAHEDVFGHQPPLSVVLHGPLNWLLRKPALTPGGFAWRSFPSEEVEVLGGVDNALETVAREGLREALTIEGTPPGQEAAVHFLLGYLARARAAGKSPRVVVVGHSSGGRAAVRFVASLRGQVDPRTGARPVRADLMVLLDPVREAHLAAQAIPRGGVESRADPARLYKPPNARRLVSVYQTTDTSSLGSAPIRLGIHGSPVHQSDRELRISFSEAETAGRAHMKIHLSGRTRELFEEELERLHRKPAKASRRAISPAFRAAAFWRSFLADAAPGRDGELVGGHNDFLYGLEAGHAADPEGFRALDQGLSGGRERQRLRLRRLLVRWERFRALDGDVRERAAPSLAAQTAAVRGQMADAVRRLRLQAEARTRPQ